MANYTPNYGLHQWEPGDDFLRTDFNQDFAKIDTALQQVSDTKADKSALTVLETALNGKAVLVTGTYTGNGTKVTIKLGFRPSAVFIPIYNRYIAAAIKGMETQLITITDSGFTVHTGGDSIVTPNTDGTVYAYLAFR